MDSGAPGDPQKHWEEGLYGSGTLALVYRGRGKETCMVTINVTLFIFTGFCDRGKLGLHNF